MPLLERIADMNPDAMETFTPAAMGGDARLAEAKRADWRPRVHDRRRSTSSTTSSAARRTRRRTAVRRLFEEAGAGGGFILAPSDHFFEADDALLHAFADEARQCRY